MTKFFRSLFSKDTRTYSLNRILHLEDDYYYPKYQPSQELVVYYLAQV